MGYLSDALWDLWDRFIRLEQTQPNRRQAINWHQWWSNLQTHVCVTRGQWVNILYHVGCCFSLVESLRRVIPSLPINELTRQELKLFIQSLTCKLANAWMRWFHRTSNSFLPGFLVCKPACDQTLFKNSHPSEPIPSATQLSVHVDTASWQLINLLHAKFFIENIKNASIIHIVAPHCHDTGSWNPS